MFTYWLFILVDKCYPCTLWMLSQHWQLIRPSALVHLLLNQFLLMCRSHSWSNSRFSNRTYTIVTTWSATTSYDQYILSTILEILTRLGIWAIPTWSFYPLSIQIKPLLNSTCSVEGHLTKILPILAFRKAPFHWVPASQTNHLEWLPNSFRQCSHWSLSTLLSSSFAASYGSCHSFANAEYELPLGYHVADCRGPFLWMIPALTLQMN